jgi:hypothetical protein
MDTSAWEEVHLIRAFPQKKAKLESVKKSARDVEALMDQWETVAMGICGRSHAYSTHSELKDCAVAVDPLGNLLLEFLTVFRVKYGQWGNQCFREFLHKLAMDKPPEATPAAVEKKEPADAGSSAEPPVSDKKSHGDI